MGFFENIQEKTQQLKEKTQNSRQKLKVSAKSKTRFAENASKKKPESKVTEDEIKKVCSHFRFLGINKGKNNKSTKKSAPASSRFCH